jgi:hypothetical protein
MTHLRHSRAGSHDPPRTPRQIGPAPTVARQDGAQSTMTRRNAITLSRCLGAIAVTVTALICAGPAAARSEGHRGGARVVPAHVIHGVTGGELAGVDFARGYAGVPETDCPRVGRRGEILQVGPNGEDGGRTVTCTVKPGTPIFVFGFGSACSDVELGTPFGGEDEAAQRTCARERTQADVLAVQVTVDGAAPVDIRSDRFEVTSPQMTAVLPADNPFDKPAGTTAHLVADIYAAAIRGLTPGQHTITVDVMTVYGPFGGTTIVDVVPGA